MKKIICGLVVFIAALSARAQQPAYPTILLVTAAPTGACTVNLPDEQVAVLGTIYTCQSGTWTLIGSGGGGGAVSSVFGRTGAVIAMAGDYTFDQIGSGTNLGHGLVCGAGCVMSPTGGGFISANELNGTLLSGLPSVILQNTTGTGVPTATSLSDNGTTAGTTEPWTTPQVQVGSPSSAAIAAIPTGAKGWACDETSTVGIPAAGVDYIRCDSATHQWLHSWNGAAEAVFGSGGGTTWPPSAAGPTFSPVAGAIASGTTVTTACTGGSPFISTGTTAVAGASGISVTTPETLYGSCQGSGYFSTGSAAYTVTTGFSIANSKFFHGTSSAITSAALPAFSSALTAGSLIIVHQYATTATFSVPTDTAGNTYIDCGPGAAAFSVSASSSRCFYALNTSTTASNIVTIHSASTTFLSALAFEVLGAASSSPIDGGVGVGYSSKANATGGAAGANNLTATTLTPAGNGDLIVAFFATSAGGATAGTSPNAFTLVNGSWVQGSEYFTQAISAAIVATASDSTSIDPYAAIVIAVKP